MDAVPAEVYDRSVWWSVTWFVIYWLSVAARTIYPFLLLGIALFLRPRSYLTALAVAGATLSILGWATETFTDGVLRIAIGEGEPSNGQNTLEFFLFFYGRNLGVCVFSIGTILHFLRHARRKAIADT